MTTRRRPSQLRIALCVGALAAALVTGSAATASPAGAMDDLCTRAMAKVQLLLFMDDVFNIGWKTVEWEAKDAFKVLDNCEPT